MSGSSAVFDYPAKSGVRRVQEVTDAAAVSVLAALKRRRGGPDELLAYREGRRWRPVRSDDINDYIKAWLGAEFSAKDFRTWNGTVLAAVALAARRGSAEEQDRRQPRDERGCEGGRRRAR